MSLAAARAAAPMAIRAREYACSIQDQGLRFVSQIVAVFDRIQRMTHANANSLEEKHPIVGCFSEKRLDLVRRPCTKRPNLTMPIANSQMPALLPQAAGCGWHLRRLLQGGL
jgi:hypothetical protein